MLWWTADCEACHGPTQWSYCSRDCRALPRMYRRLSSALTCRAGSSNRLELCMIPSASSTSLRTQPQQFQARKKQHRSTEAGGLGSWAEREPRLMASSFRPLCTASSASFVSLENSSLCRSRCRALDCVDGADMTSTQSAVQNPTKSCIVISALRWQRANTVRCSVHASSVALALPEEPG